MPGSVKVDAEIQAPDVIAAGFKRNSMNDDNIAEQVLGMGKIIVASQFEVKLDQRKITWQTH